MKNFQQLFQANYVVRGKADLPNKIIAGFSNIVVGSTGDITLGLDISGSSNITVNSTGSIDFVNQLNGTSNIVVSSTATLTYASSGSPSEVSDLLVWFRADGVSESAGSVTSWAAEEDNVGGAAGTLTPSSVGRRPTYSATSCGGADGVTFGTATDATQSSVTYLDDTVYAKSFFFVIDDSADSPSSNRFIFSASGNHRLYATANDRFAARIEREGSGANTSSTGTDEVITGCQGLMFTIEEAAGDTTINTWVYDGTSWNNIETDVFSGFETADSFVNTYVLGNLTTGTTTGMNMVLGDFVVYDKILDGSDRTSLKNYMDSRYTF